MRRLLIVLAPLAIAMPAPAAPATTRAPAPQLYDALFVTGHSWSFRASATDTHKPYDVTCEVRDAVTVDDARVAALTCTTPAGVAPPLFAGFYIRTAAGLWYAPTKPTAADIAQLDPRRILIPAGLPLAARSTDFDDADLEERATEWTRSSLCVRHGRSRGDGELEFRLCFEDGDLASAAEHAGDDAVRRIRYERR